MAVFNYLRKEIDAKIVYYGPAVCGKTTNLQHVHQNLKPEQRGKMVSLATNEDRTLFFDFLPVELESVRGFKTRFHLYTVPGQAYYGATRRAVLTGADGVVFVADSQAEKLDENLFSLKDMEENLRYYGKRIETIPLVIQYNKRDLPNILPIEELNQKINRFNVPYFESVAITGKGVFETLTMACQLVLRAIEAGVEARRMAAAVPEGVPEPQPRGVGKGLGRPEIPKSGTEGVSKKILRLEKEEPAGGWTEDSSPTVSIPQAPTVEKMAPPAGPIPPPPPVGSSASGMAFPSPVSKPEGSIRTPDRPTGSPPAGSSPIPPSRPGLSLRSESRASSPEASKPRIERPSYANLRLENVSSEAEPPPPVSGGRTGIGLRAEKAPLPTEVPPARRDGGAIRPISFERPIEKIEKEIHKPQERLRDLADRREPEPIPPENAIEALGLKPATPETSPSPETPPVPAGLESKRLESRSFLSRMFERKKGEAAFRPAEGPGAKEFPIPEKSSPPSVEKASPPPEKIRIVSCGQPRIFPPAGLEIPLLLKLDGQERSFSLNLKIELDPASPKTE